MDLNRIKSILAEKLGDENVIDDAEMKNYCSFRCGGRAKLLVNVNDIDTLRYALYVLGGADKMFPTCSCNCCRKETTPYMIIGNGSNILVRDGGYEGVIIRLDGEFRNIKREGNRIIAGPAALLSAISRAAASWKLTGLEFASGIPGSAGGAVFMNAGAYGGEMKDVVRSVKTISKDGITESYRTSDELELSYRHSIFNETEDIITEVEFELTEGNPEEISERMKDLAERRNTKQPLKYPSAGSFFKRPEGHFAGALIEEAGLKGLSVGGACVSELHAGFIVNKGDATATDIIRLMKLVQNTVMDKAGVMLTPEVRIIGEDEQ